MLDAYSKSIQGFFYQASRFQDLKKVRQTIVGSQSANQTMLNNLNRETD
jgi:hypothetical protein